VAVKVREKEHARFADSIGYIFSLNVKQKECIIDEIFQKQPELLFECLGLHYLDVPEVRMEYVLNLLLIFYDYFSDRGKIKLPKVTKKMVKDARHNLIAMRQLMDKEGQETGLPLFRKAVEAYPEIEAMAFFVGYMNENGFFSLSRENKYCLRVGKVILDCFAKINKGKG